ncbi:uncharacterized protein [Argopecten irradians]|uniref:uncharacterized protein n=1 Tax=Argopecten irradians TaxID=31199 RepID=UPI00371E9F62
MRRTQISFSGAVDLNRYDLPAAVRRNDRNPFALEKEAYALGSLPQRNVSPIFDGRNRPPPPPSPREDDPDYLPITEQPKPHRGIRHIMSSPSPDDESESNGDKWKTTLIKLKPKMQTSDETGEEEAASEKPPDGSKARTLLKSFVMANAAFKGKMNAKPGVEVPAKPEKIKPASVSWPGPDDHLAHSCILWCCCCVGNTSWPPKRKCFPDKTCCEYFCPCCRVSICCPCCVECCERYSCRICCAGLGRCIQRECCAICVDFPDEEEEEEKKEDEKKKDDKDKKEKTDRKDGKGKEDSKKK